MNKYDLNEKWGQKLLYEWGWQHYHATPATRGLGI